MAIVSVTAVGAFESVGSILVVALMITPPAAAYLLTNRLSHMLIISALLGILAAVLGYALAHWLDASISGAMATMSGVIFLLVLIFAPEKGLLAKWILKKWTQWDFASSTLSLHLLQAELAHAEEAERIVTHMQDHMQWNNEYTSEVIAQCIAEGLIKKQGKHLSLTPFGREKAKHILEKS